MDKVELDKWQVEHKKHSEVSHFMMSRTPENSQKFAKVIFDLLDEIHYKDVVIQGCVTEISGIEIASTDKETNWNFINALPGGFLRNKSEVEENNLRNATAYFSNISNLVEFDTEMDAVIAICNWSHNIYDPGTMKKYVKIFSEYLGDDGLLAISTARLNPNTIDKIYKSPTFEADGFEVKYTSHTTKGFGNSYQRKYSVKYRKIGSKIWNTNNHTLKYYDWSTEELSQYMVEAGFVDVEVTTNELAKNHQIVRGYNGSK